MKKTYFLVIFTVITQFCMSQRLTKIDRDTIKIIKSTIERIKILELNKDKSDEVSLELEEYKKYKLPYYEIIVPFGQAFYYINISKIGDSDWHSRFLNEALTSISESEENYKIEIPLLSECNFTIDSIKKTKLFIENLIFGNQSENIKSLIKSIKQLALNKDLGDEVSLKLQEYNSKKLPYYNIIVPFGQAFYYVNISKLGDSNWQTNYLKEALDNIKQSEENYQIEIPILSECKLSVDSIKKTKLFIEKLLNDNQSLIIKKPISFIALDEDIETDVFKNCKITYIKNYNVKFDELVPVEGFELIIKDTIFDRLIYDIEYNISNSTYNQNFYIYNNPSLPNVFKEGSDKTPEYGNFVLSLYNIFNGVKKIIRTFSNNKTELNKCLFDNSVLNVINDIDSVETIEFMYFNYNEMLRFYQNYPDFRGIAYYDWKNSLRKKLITTYKNNSKIVYSEEYINYYSNKISSTKYINTYLDSSYKIVITKQYVDDILTDKQKSIYDENHNLLKLYGYESFDNSEYLKEENKYNFANQLIEKITYNNSIRKNLNGLINSKTINKYVNDTLITIKYNTKDNGKTFNEYSRNKVYYVYGNGKIKEAHWFSPNGIVIRKTIYSYL